MGDMINWIARVVFYVVVTPIAWVLRLLGRDPLGDPAAAGTESYWSEYSNTRPDDMAHQR